MSRALLLWCGGDGGAESPVGEGGRGASEEDLGLLFCRARAWTSGDVRAPRAARLVEDEGDEGRVSVTPSMRL